LLCLERHGEPRPGEVGVAWHGFFFEEIGDTDMIIVFTGHLGADAEVRQVGKDDVCNFRVGVYNGKDEDSEWFDVAAWGDFLIGRSEHLRKGDMVHVTAQFSTVTKDGKKYNKARAVTVDGPKKDDARDSRSNGNGRREEPRREESRSSSRNDDSRSSRGDDRGNDSRRGNDDRGNGGRGERDRSDDRGGSRGSTSYG